MFIQLVSGFAAGVFGAMLNTPGDTIRTNVQKAVFSGESITVIPSFLSAGRDIVNRRGISALYAGFGSKAVHSGGGGALMAFLVPFFREKYATL